MLIEIEGKKQEVVTGRTVRGGRERDGNLVRLVVRLVSIFGRRIKFSFQIVLDDVDELDLA